MAEWYAKLPKGIGTVRIERITYPSRGDVESTCLCQVMSWDGSVAIMPPFRIAVRELEMRM